MLVLVSHRQYSKMKFIYVTWSGGPTPEEISLHDMLLVLISQYYEMKYIFYIQRGTINS